MRKTSQKLKNFYVYPIRTRAHVNDIIQIVFTGTGCSWIARSKGSGITRENLPCVFTGSGLLDDLLRAADINSKVDGCRTYLSFFFCVVRM